MKTISVLTLLTFAWVGASFAQTRDALSVEALVADASTYVAGRYAATELPSALIADLTAQGFECQSAAAGAECTRARAAAGACFDVINVSVGAGVVSATQDRRCMGAEE